MVINTVTLYYTTVFAWFIFGTYWLISGLKTRINVKTGQKTHTTTIRFVQLTGSAIAFTLIFWRNNFLAYVILPRTIFAISAGLILLVLSLSFAIWARVILGANWSAAIQSVESQKLINYGPYKYIRHPMYTGVIGGICGTMLIQGTLAGVIALILITFCYVLKINAEEKFLQKFFGQRYAQYQARTWRLIPFVY